MSQYLPIRGRSMNEYAWTHSQEQVAQIAASIAQFGFT